MLPIARTIEERFFAKVNKAGPIPDYAPELGPCWLWIGATDGDKRYGSFCVDGRLVRAHRWAFEHVTEVVVPAGRVTDHLCRVTLCVKPSHLEPVTQHENIMRGSGFAAVNARKTHCKWGHEFTPENTGTVRGGGRYCRQCTADYNLSRRAMVSARS